MAPEDGDIEGCGLNMEQDIKDSRLSSIKLLVLAPAFGQLK